MASEAAVGDGTSFTGQITPSSPAFVIYLKGNEYSERVADRCIDTAKRIGNIDVAPYPGVSPERAASVMFQSGLEWGWGRPPPELGMNHHMYGGPLQNRIGCAMSHYKLWKACVQLNHPILILEHDAVFINELKPFSFKSACMVNDPKGATPRGKHWRDGMVKVGPGVWPKTRIFGDERPDGLAGGSAYCIQPWTAAHVIRLCHTFGLWPNDAILCRQLVPDLEQHYPFLTKVVSERSTTNDA